MFRRIKVNKNQRGLVFERGVLIELLRDGTHWRFDPWLELNVQVVSVEDAWLLHPRVDAIAKSGLLGSDATVLDVGDEQRALVWVDGRFDRIVQPGVAVLWNVLFDVKVEMIDATKTRFTHRALPAILGTEDTDQHLDVREVPTGFVGLFYEDGKFVEALGPGRYAFWRGLAKVTVHFVDLREQVLDIASQEIMTSDKVTLRMTAVVTFVVSDAQKAIESVGDFRQAMYRDAQLALRAVVGTKSLDELLANKDAVSEELAKLVRDEAAPFGVRVDGFGLKDLVLPGDMKTLMNQVMEAKKAAEAALITRREETAAMRSQANTAKILEANPTLMRLKELEVLEKVAEKSNLTVVLGEHGLSDRLAKLL